MTAAAAVVERRADRNRTTEDEEKNSNSFGQCGWAWPILFFAVAVADIGSAQALVVKLACVMQQHWNQTDEREKCTFTAFTR